MEVQESLTDPFLLQSFDIANAELVQMAPRIRQGVGDQAPEPPRIVLECLVVFRVNCLHLSLCRVFLEKWSYEELSEPVEGTLETLI
jgi:hypothetical protein